MSQNLEVAYAMHAVLKGIAKTTNDIIAKYKEYDLATEVVLGSFAITIAGIERQTPGFRDRLALFLLEVSKTKAKG